MLRRLQAMGRKTAIAPQEIMPATVVAEGLKNIYEQFTRNELSHQILSKDSTTAKNARQTALADFRAAMGEKSVGVSPLAGAIIGIAKALDPEFLTLLKDKDLIEVWAHASRNPDGLPFGNGAAGAGVLTMEQAQRMINNANPLLASIADSIFDSLESLVPAWAGAEWRKRRREGPSSSPERVVEIISYVMSIGTGSSQQFAVSMRHEIVQYMKHSPSTNKAHTISSLVAMIDGAAAVAQFTRGAARGTLDAMGSELLLTLLHEIAAGSYGAHARAMSLDFLEVNPEPTELELKAGLAKIDRYTQQHTPKKQQPKNANASEIKPEKDSKPKAKSRAWESAIEQLARIFGKEHAIAIGEARGANGIAVCFKHQNDTCKAAAGTCAFAHFKVPKPSAGAQVSAVVAGGSGAPVVPPVVEEEPDALVVLPDGGKAAPGMAYAMVCLHEESAIHGGDEPPPPDGYESSDGDAPCRESIPGDGDGGGNGGAPRAPSAIRVCMCNPPGPERATIMGANGLDNSLVLLVAMTILTYRHSSQQELIVLLLFITLPVQALTLANGG